MKKQTKFIALLMAAALILSGGTQNILAVENTTATRLYGDTRIQTAIEVCKEVYATSDNVVLAGYSGEVDAMTGTLLASAKKAPLLLTPKNNIPENLKAELQRLNVKNIYILGGDAAVGKVVEEELEKEYIVKRIFGNNREETAVAVAKEVNGQTKHIFLAKGYGILADALSIGPVSAIRDMPIFLTQTDNLPKTTLDAIKELGVTHITIIGGNTAISKSVEDQLKSYEVNRISGTTREGTALAIAKKYFPTSEKTILASGYVYADALVGGYLGAKNNAPILLTSKTKLVESTYKYIQNNYTSAYILGGKTVVDSAVEASLNKALKGEQAIETVSQQQAIKSAKNYLNYSAFSRSGLIKQLEFEGFSTADATYAVDSINVNWREQAVKSAKNYLNYSSFSRSGLIKQLEFDGFSTTDATYAVDSISVNWREQAKKSAKNYLDYTSFSRSGLIKQLEFDGFNTADATYAVDSIGVNWKEQAVKTAKKYLDYSSFSRAGLIKQLEFDGFSTVEATYAVDQIGL